MKLFHLLLCSFLLCWGNSISVAQDTKATQKSGSTTKTEARAAKAKSAAENMLNDAKKLVKAGADVEVYKNTTDANGEPVELKLFIFKPEGHKASDKKAAIVFFFGGGWNSGSPTQFVEHCKYLADRGMVAMTADYRVFSRQGTRASACVSDGKSAVRWIRENAERLGIDPNKVAAGGGSAGGHVAACTGVIKTLDEPNENLKISSKPNALVLFNPALVLGALEGGPKIPKELEKRFAQLERRVGADPKTVSPAHNVAKDEPPTIIFHGKADKTVPYVTAETFTKIMQDAGNDCELVGYEKQGHGFFNAKRKNSKYTETVKEMDRFLVGLGFIDAKKN